MKQQWRSRFCGLILAAAFLASGAAHAEEKIYIVTSLPDLADIAARTVQPDTEVPIGVITAAIGAPFFLFVLRSRRARADSS